MIVSVRARAPKKSIDVKLFNAPSKSQKLQIDKGKLESCIQMLHDNEACTLAKSTEALVRLRGLQNNKFEVLMMTMNQLPVVGVVSCSSITVDQTPEKLDPSVCNLLTYAQKQILPVYSKAQLVAKSIQQTLGSVLMQPTEQLALNFNCLAGADTNFMRSNACSVSKLVDILNAANCGRDISPTVAARLAMLAATYCASAPLNESGNLFHVSQLQMTDFPTSISDCVYEQQPEKQHITILMRGDNADDRIKRINLAVRIFPQDSELVRTHLPKLTGMNSNILSGVLVVTGVRNQQAAAIFLSSETLTTNSHGFAMQAFK